MTTIRSVTAGTNNGSSPTVTATTPSEGDVAQAGDVLLIIHGNDFYEFANMGTPEVSPGSPTLTPVPNGSADSGATGAHIRSYTATVASGGAQTVSVTESAPGDEDKCLVVYVLAGADAANPVDVAAGATGTPATAQPAPSVTTTTADALLICHNNSGGGASTASYTTPGGMVEQYETHVGGMSSVGATEQLVAAGATGTRTFTAASSVPWAGVTIAIRSAAGGGLVEAHAVEAAATAAAADATASVAPGAVTAAALAEALFEPGTHVSVELIADAPIEVQADAHNAAVLVGPVAGTATAAATGVDAATVVSAMAGLASGSAAAVDATVSTAIEESALAEAAAAAGAALDVGAVVAVTAGVAMAAAAAVDAAGPGVPVSVGGMRPRARRGPEMAGGRRRAAAMTGGSR
ncbi:hypothetical protein ACU635_50590 [[Actinomadura] parvosata]|uniref:hypothetical protein n=1 Tax=[Actinomadura] parvosata TaxID=1955412 RepID=UPI00406BF381